MLAVEIEAINENRPGGTHRPRFPSDPVCSTGTETEIQGTVVREDSVLCGRIRIRLSDFRLIESGRVGEHAG